MEYNRYGMRITYNLACDACGHTWKAVQTDISCQECDAPKERVRLANSPPKKTAKDKEVKVYHFGGLLAMEELMEAMIERHSYTTVASTLIAAHHKRKFRDNAKSNN